MAPTAVAGSPAGAREWVEGQWHYKHTRIERVYSDRASLDAAAGVNQFVETSYQYDAATARLDHVVNPNGSRSYFDFDGYGTLYRSYVTNPSGGLQVRGAKLFVNPFLETVGAYESDDTDHLWTLVERNGAGAVTKVTEPSTTAPAGYSPVAISQTVQINYSTGGASHHYELDKFGRATRVTTMDGSETMAERNVRYDQLSRRIMEHSVARIRDGNASVAVGDHYSSWEYRAGSASQVGVVRHTGVDDTVIEYWPSGLTKKRTQAGDRVDYDYFPGTAFLKAMDRTDLDPIDGTRLTATDYAVDPFGQVVKITEGANLGLSDQLHHLYAYNSLGRVDVYEDPIGLVQKFLPDAAGRIVEHARVGGSSDILNWSVFVDSGQADGRTVASRFDHQGNETQKHSDFAGRPFIVMNPGASVVPTKTSPHQPLSVYAAYDGASRVSALYDGDYGIRKFARDGMGRAIKRWLELPASGPQPDNISDWNTLDWMRRDALGRIEQNDYYANPASPSIIGVGQSFQDSFGRVHKERFNFALASTNVIETVSTFAGGNPYRDELEYLDGVLSVNSAEPVSHRIGQFKHADDQRAVVGFGRFRRPVARFEVGNQLVNEDPGRQADRR